LERKALALQPEPEKKKDEELSEDIPAPDSLAVRLSATTLRDDSSIQPHTIPLTALAGHLLTECRLSPSSSRQLEAKGTGTRYPSPLPRSLATKPEEKATSRLPPSTMATLSKADKELVRERERMKEKEKEKELDKELEKELTRERERLREVEREKELVRDRERMKEREKEREKLLREKQERSSKDPSPAHSSASSSASSSPSDSPASQARAHLASAAIAPVRVIAAWPDSGKSPLQQAVSGTSPNKAKEEASSTPRNGEHKRKKARTEPPAKEGPASLSPPSKDNNGIRKGALSTSLDPLSVCARVLFLVKPNSTDLCSHSHHWSISSTDCSAGPLSGRVQEAKSRVGEELQGVLRSAPKAERERSILPGRGTDSSSLSSPQSPPCLRANALILTSLSLSRRTWAVS
jgi:hypothetical protein